MSCTHGWTDAHTHTQHCLSFGSCRSQKEIENLKKDIECLNVANNKKEMSIKSLTKSLNELEEKIEMGDETDSDENEDIDFDEDSSSSYMDKPLALVDETKDEIEKMRKNTRDAKVKVEKLYQELSSLPSIRYSDPIRKLEEFVKSNESKLDKDTCVTKLMDLKKQLQKLTC